MASSALRSALRSTACMQAVDLKPKLLLRLTGRGQRSVGNSSATPGPPKFGRGLRTCPGAAIGRASASAGWPLQAGAPAGPAEQRGQSLAMGHSPEQIAGRLALEHGRVISERGQSIVSSIIVRPRRITGTRLPRHKLRREAPPTPKRQPQAVSSNNGARSLNGPPRSKVARCRAIGKPTSCCSPDMAKGLLVLHERQTRFSMVHQPADRKAIPHRSHHRPSTRQASTGDAQKPSVSTTERSSPSITGFTKLLASKPSSAIPIVRGKGGVENSIGRLRRSCHAN